MIVIKSCDTITPAEPTFDGPFPLSEIDQCKAWSLAPTIYYYPPNHNVLSFPFSRLVETLKVSLSRALVPFYPLAGRLRWIGGGRLELVCNGMGIEFVVAESDSTVEGFGGVDSSDRVKPLLPLIDYDVPIEKLPVMSVRVTRFACGGVAVGLAISHMLADGASAMQFIRSWTKLARGEVETDVVPFHDRRLLMNMSSPPSSPSHHLDILEPYKPLPFIMGRVDAKEEEEKETSVAMLKLTKEQIEGIHNQANANYEVQEKEVKSPYSRFESITAHIWRTACKARAHEREQPTVCVTVGDFRRRVTTPPIPKGYFGNAVLITTTDPKCVSGELVSKPLSYAASKVREGVRKMTGSFMNSAIEFIGNQKDVSWTRTGFHVAGSKKGMFLGNPNIRVTSWIGMPIHDADFGWGKPSYMGPGAISTDGRSYIIPSCDQDGSWVVALRFQTSRIALFQELFYQDIIN